MKKENLSDALNLINDDIIEKTDSVRKIDKKYKIMRTFRTCVAACLVIAIGIGSAILLPKLRPRLQDPQPNPPDFSNLPILTISQNVGDNGFEAYMAHDISELVNSNPWYDGCEVTTLPVYKNTLDINKWGEITKFDSDKMNSFILDIAKRYGL